MKKISIMLLSTILTSCSILDNSRIAPGYSQAYVSIKNALFGYEDTGITREMIEEIPYASALLRIGKGPIGLVILESFNESKQTWVSADSAYIVMQNGKIIQTKGLNNNLTKLTSPFDGSNFLKVDDQRSYKYYLSYDEPYLRDLEVDVKFYKREKESIEILGEEMDLMLVEEEISNSYIGWRVKNSYWVDEDYFVWKSEQYISPRLPKLVIEVTKKPS